MKPAAIGAIKKELAFLPGKDLQELCLQLIQYQKNNKELATYFLFYKHNEAGFKADLKAWLDVAFEEIFNNYYVLLKDIKKISKLLILRLKCSSNKQTETELLLYFLEKTQLKLGKYNQYKAVESLYVSHVKKAVRAMHKLHEDLQSMYLEQLEQQCETMGYPLHQILN
jgi:hypothetical protein